MLDVINLFSRICYLLAVIADFEEFDDSFQPLSRVEEILTAKIKGDEYTGDLLSRLEVLFAVWCGFKTPEDIDFQPIYRSEEILWSKIFDTEYEGDILSKAEELLMALKSEEGEFDKDDPIVGYGQVDYAILTS